MPLIRPALAPGVYRLGFDLPNADGLAICAEERASLEVAAAPATRAPVEPSPPRRHCPAIACGGCPYGYAPSTDGCPSCQCLELAPAPHR